MTGDPIRVLVVDDHPLMREGIVAVLSKQADILVVGEAENGAEAIAMYREVKPDVALMDLQMPELDGVAAITGIRAEFPAARIIVLTTYAGDVMALRALRAGATGYLLKNTIRKELIAAVRSVHSGKRYLAVDVATEIALHAIDRALSEREASVLNLVAAGKANKQIAWELSMSEETVKTHLRSIFSKLGVADRTHAVTVAAKRGIIDL